MFVLDYLSPFQYFGGCRILQSCYTGKSSIHGTGVFANAKIRRRSKIGSLRGAIKKRQLISKRIFELKRIFIVELSESLVLDSSRITNELCYINHSCYPNCYMRIFNLEVEIYALRDIRKDEELTINYGETHHGGKVRCRCLVSDCTHRL